MKKNVNKSDMTIRFIIAVIALGLSITDFFEDQFLDTCLLALGVVMLVTGILRFCPFYYLMEIDTTRERKKRLY